MSNSPDLRLKA